jgi:TonB family protein
MLRGTPKREHLLLFFIVLAVHGSVSVPSIDLPQIDFAVDRNNAAVSTAPSLQYSARSSMQPYIRQAALLPGEGATVVLRIEVLGDGEPGRIQIETSSGSARIDQAAIDYARSQHWYAGRLNGEPHSMWIRWGVRLQA